MAREQVVRSANRKSWWVMGPKGEYGLRLVGREYAEGYARDRGISRAAFDAAPEAQVVVSDPLSPATSYDAETSTLIEEPESYAKVALLATAWLSRELLRDPANERFRDLVIRHDGEIFIEQSAPFTVWDDGIYWPHIPCPGCDGEVKRNVRQLSKGHTITSSRARRPSRKFVSLDLRRTWTLADRFERECVERFEKWNEYGRAEWKRLGRLV
jgi:hypothetical protein